MSRRRRRSRRRPRTLSGPSAGERRGQQRQRRGGQQRCEGALQRAGGDEHSERLGKASKCGGAGEADQARDKCPLAPEEITELASEQQQASERHAGTILIMMNTRIATAKVTTQTG